MHRQSLSIALTGSGGSGVMTTGSLLLEAAAIAGWYGFMSRSAGPQIRGGEAAAVIRLACEPIESPDDSFDLVIAIDPGSLTRFIDEVPLRPDSFVISDADAGRRGGELPDTPAQVFDFPMKELAKTVKGGRPNMIALGALAKMIGLPEESIYPVLEKVLKTKGPDVIETSWACVKAGLVAGADLPVFDSPPLDNGAAIERWSITGNEAAGLGAIRGGIRFVAAYPITPATELLEWLATSLPKVGGVLVQAEDELASINQIIGASFGGTPALTATSGPGFALMTESIGLAVCAEVPAVILDVMRCGPSTGIATKSEQSDLNIALNGLHGDAPHLVLAPTSVTDCVFTTQWAVYLAEAMQTAAIVLSDQSLGQTRAIVKRPADISFIASRSVPDQYDETYYRYAVGGSGVSPMSIPGQAGGQYTADGLEHNQAGAPSSLPEDHYAQLEKRHRKIIDFDYGEQWAIKEGAGATAVITWGSSTGPVREALSRLREQDEDIRLISLRLLAPERPLEMAVALKGVKRILVVEQSHSRQFHRYLRAAYDLNTEVRVFNRPGPLPFRPAEIMEQLTLWQGETGT
ncbi:MAG: 2-oxoacid:acceptor oxidoreductase subunit alpha [Xanthomonadales bacterium]|nr:2-oxoacid:acceptor oxidoreductase subunit alpha [Xanthomonadales bacterium]